MPRICYFYGIAIYMYYRDHPPPHFHAIYGEYEAEISIDSGEISKGRLPNRAETLVLEWLKRNRTTISKNWELAQQGQPLMQVSPLE